MQSPIKECPVYYRGSMQAVPLFYTYYTPRYIMLIQRVYSKDAGFPGQFAREFHEYFNDIQ